MNVFQRCVNPRCQATFDVGEVLHRCPTCGALLDVEYDWDKLPTPKKLADFEQ